MKLLLANPRGFCAGVDRAIEIVKKVLEEKGSPIYVKHEVVHNKIVVKELENLEQLFELATQENNSAVIKDCEKKINLLHNQIKKTEVSCF